MAVVITSVSTKGGVGKTTLCKFLSVVKAREGKKVLIIDICQNSDIATRLGYDRESFVYTSYEFLTDEKNEIKLEDIIQHDEETGVDFIPSGPRIDKYQEYVNGVRPVGPEKEFERKIKTLADRYDYILIDNHPTETNQMIFYSLCASDIALIPTLTDISSILATDRTLKLIKSLNKYDVPVKPVVVPTAVDFTKGLGKYAEKMKDEFESATVLSPIRYSSKMNTDGLEGKIIDLENKYIKKVVEDYEQVSRELDALLNPIA